MRERLFLLIKPLYDFLWDRHELLLRSTNHESRRSTVSAFFFFHHPSEQAAVSVVSRHRFTPKE
jgi:hypothetical protein